MPIIITINRIKLQFDSVGKAVGTAMAPTTNAPESMVPVELPRVDAIVAAGV